ncbi:hypothetical protein Gste01_03012 [Geobacillus stearothermophilus ATCC 7953]
MGIHGLALPFLRNGRDEDKPGRFPSRLFPRVLVEFDVKVQEIQRLHLGFRPFFRPSAPFFQAYDLFDRGLNPMKPGAKGRLEGRQGLFGIFPAGEGVTLPTGLFLAKKLRFFGSFFFKRLSFSLVERARFNNDQPNGVAFIRRGRFPYPVRGAVSLRQRKGIAPRRVLSIRFGQRGFHDPERRRASGDQKGVGRFGLRQGLFRHRGGIGHVNPFVFNLGLFELFVDTGQHLRIPRFVRQVAIVHIAVKRDAVLVADQSETDLFLPTMMAVVAMCDLQSL